MTTIQEFDFSVNVLSAMLWQYNSAPNLLSLMEQKQAWYDANQEQFWLDWYNNVFNLQTANQFGLSVWAIILDIPIIVATNPSPPDDPGLFFGDLHKNFTHGNFFRNNPSAVQLTVEQARTVLRMRYFQITSKGTVPEINKFMNILFGSQGGCYVVDNYDMTASYFFLFTLPSALKYLFNNYDILPRPAGVKVTSGTAVMPAFGFGDNNENFDNGSFWE